MNKSRINTNFTPSQFYIKVIDEDCGGIFIDDLILKGREMDLMHELCNLDYVCSLGIDDSFLFKKFILIDTNDITFPEYMC